MIVIEHKDRGACFGFCYLESLLTTYGRAIEVVNQAENANEDLIADLQSIIYSFCARLYGQRRAKRKTEKIVEELTKRGDEDATRWHNQAISAWHRGQNQTSECRSGSHIVPKKAGCYIVEVVYTIDSVQGEVNQFLIASVDIGINNLVALTSNKGGFVPCLVNGRPIKSVN